VAYRELLQQVLASKARYGEPVAAPAPGGEVQGLIYANLGWRDDPWMEDHLVFGEGNMDLYVRHLPTGEYRVIDRVPGNTIEVPATLEELLAVALAAHL